MLNHMQHTAVPAHQGLPTHDKGQTSPQLLPSRDNIRFEIPVAVRIVSQSGLQNCQQSTDVRQHRAERIDASRTKCARALFNITFIRGADKRLNHAAINLPARNVSGKNSKHVDMIISLRTAVVGTARVSVKGQDICATHKSRQIASGQPPPLLGHNEEYREKQPTSRDPGWVHSRTSWQLAAKREMLMTVLLGGGVHAAA